MRHVCSKAWLLGNVFWGGGGRKDQISSECIFWVALFEEDRCVEEDEACMCCSCFGCFLWATPTANCKKKIKLKPFKTHGPAHLNLFRGQRWLHHDLILLGWSSYQKHVAPLSLHAARWWRVGLQCFSFVTGCVLARKPPHFIILDFLVSLSGFWLHLLSIWLVSAGSSGFWSDEDRGPLSWTGLYHEHRSLYVHACYTQWYQAEKT